MSSITTVRDQVETRAAGMAEALVYRMNPRSPLTDKGRQYGSMSILEIGREFLNLHGIATRGLDRFQVVSTLLAYRGAGMLGTSDFPSLLANVANKRLRQAYDENTPSYQVWARRAPDAPDFKQINVVQLSNAPDLLQVSEQGEFKYGSLIDHGETYSVLTYGRIVPLTRQAMINDDLRGFDRLLQGFAASARRIENRLVYAQLTGNAALSDNIALFHASHGNLAASGGAIGAATLQTARAAMRKQKGLQGEELNLAPRFLIVPASQEQLAYQYTSANYVPALPASVNEFRAGGRTALEPVAEAILDASSTTAWYLAADPAQVDTVEYCWLEGNDGPFVESRTSFETDGIECKGRLDFAAKAIDFRGLYKDPGA